VEWQAALASGEIFNAMDACNKLGVDAEQLDALWAKTNLSLSECWMLVFQKRRSKNGLLTHGW